MKYYRVEHINKDKKRIIKTIKTDKSLSELRIEFDSVEEIDNESSKTLKELGVLEISYED